MSEHELEPDKDILHVIEEDYEIDEDSNPDWPTTPVSVGLPKRIMQNGKMTLVDYRFIDPNTRVESIKKVIPRPDYIKVRNLVKKIGV